MSEGRTDLSTLLKHSMFIHDYFFFSFHSCHPGTQNKDISFVHCVICFIHPQGFLSSGLKKNKISKQQPFLHSFSDGYFPENRWIVNANVSKLSANADFWGRKMDIYHSLHSVLAAGVCAEYVLTSPVIYNCCNELHVPHQFNGICVTGDNGIALCWHRAQSPHQQATKLKPITVCMYVCKRVCVCMCVWYLICVILAECKC